MRAFFFTALFIACHLPSTTLYAQEPGRYTLMEIIAGSHGTTATRMNTAGILVGRARFATGTRAFRYEAGAITFLDSLGDGTRDSAGVVSESGMILGNSHNGVAARCSMESGR